MSDQLEGRAAVVTGGASGIGRALVDALTGAGAQVLAVDVDESGLAAVAEATGCRTRRADVGSRDENEALVADAVGAFGRLDLVFLNAGVLGRQPRPAEWSITDLDADLHRFPLVSSVNIDGVVYGTVAAAKAMATDGGGHGGSIVVTASVAGLVGFSPTPMYSLSKAAVIGWVRATASNLASDGVRINAICPAGVATPLIGLDESAADGVPSLLAPADLAAEMIATATSDATGEAFSVVGGRDPLRQQHPFEPVPGFG